MRYPTDEQIAAFKQKAAATTGNPTVAIIEHEEAEFVGVFRPLTRPEWNAYLDKATSHDTAADARWNAVVKTMLWPSASELTAARRACPALPAKLAERLDELAGGSDDDRPRAVPLDATTTPEMLAEVGLPEDDARQLLTTFPGRRQLRIAVHPQAGPFVVKMPTGPAWDGFSARSSKEYAAACYDLTIDCIVWPTDDVKRTKLEQFPGIPHVLSNLLAEMGGGRSKARAKKV